MSTVTRLKGAGLKTPGHLAGSHRHAVSDYLDDLLGGDAGLDGSRAFLGCGEPVLLRQGEGGREAEGGLAAEETRTTDQPDPEALKTYLDSQKSAPTYAIGFLR